MIICPVVFICTSRAHILTILFSLLLRAREGFGLKVISIFSDVGGTIIIVEAILDPFPRVNNDYCNRNRVRVIIF